MQKRPAHTDLIIYSQTGLAFEWVYSEGPLGNLPPAGPPKFGSSSVYIFCREPRIPGWHVGSLSGGGPPLDPGRARSTRPLPSRHGEGVQMAGALSRQVVRSGVNIDLAIG